MLANSMNLIRARRNHSPQRKSCDFAKRVARDEFVLERARGKKHAAKSDTRVSLGTRRLSISPVRVP